MLLNDKRRGQEPSPRTKKIINIVGICFGLAMALVVIIGIIVTLPKDDDKQWYKMTKQQFAELAESGDDDALWESAYFWTENFCPVDSAKRFTKASAPVKNVQAIMHLDNEVLEGGFPQFYYNGYDGYGFDFVHAFRVVGLDDVADIVVRADNCFNQIKHTMPSANASLSDFSAWYENNPLTALDDEYADKQTDVFTAVVRYIKDNISYFGD